jgi:peptide deformylase
MMNPVSITALQTRFFIEFKARDFAARVVQHEYDHIDGILFLDRMRSMESLAFVSIVSATAPAF